MDVQRREPFVRGLPTSRVLKREINRALNGDGDDADMALSIIGRRPIEDTSPGPSPVIAEPEPGVPDEPGIDEGIGPFLGAKLDLVLFELRKLNEVPSFKPGSPTSIVGRVSTNSSDYIDLASWIIAPDRVGSVQEVSFNSDTPATAQFRLIIANEEQWTDLILDAPLTIPFRENELSGDTEILLQVQSDGVATIIAFASIAGVEREA